MKAILVIDVDDCINLTKYGANIYLSEKQDYYPCRRFVQEYLNVPLKPMPERVTENVMKGMPNEEWQMLYDEGWNDCLGEIEE